MNRALDVFRDLYNLEINLIENPSMTARKMDSLSAGMAQVAEKYSNYLEDLARRAGVDAPDLRALVEQAPNYDRQTYVGLIAVAKAALAVDDAGRPRYDLTGQDRVIVKRILGTSEQLSGIAGRWGGRFVDATNDPTEVTDAERLKIRKAWDIGTEVVVMQTVAQLDGDIITRISPERTGPMHESVRTTHQELIATSLTHWRELFQTVALLAGQSVSALFKR